MIEAERKIYEQYQNIIAPFIMELEVRDCEYPVEIFNEIRAIFTHLSRYKLQQKEDEVVSAERHTKRAILDCFKYLCVSIASKIKTFRNDYRKVDLKLAANGTFLPELDRLESVAEEAYKKAKRMEIKQEVSEDELFSLFEKAYNAYSSLDQFLNDSNEAILFASSHSRRSNALNVISISVTILSIAIAVISFLT